MAKVILFKDCQNGNHKKCVYHSAGIFCSCDCHKKEKVRPFETKKQSDHRKAVEVVIKYSVSLEW